MELGSIPRGSTKKVVNTFMNDNLLFASVNLPILDCNKAAEKILALDNSYSFWDDYRYTKMIPLMTKLGSSGKLGADNYKEGEFLWLNYTPTILKEYFEEVVFPWTKTKSRVMALITQPDVKNYEHIDCERHEVNTRQHKFRIVLQGETDTLYFKTKQGNVSAPNIKKPFIMDGGWPHGMYNKSNEIKVTIALGAPWTGKDYYDDINLLINRNDYDMPDDLEPYFIRKNKN